MLFILLLTLLPLHTSAITNKDARLIGWKLINDFITPESNITTTTSDYTDEICGATSKTMAPPLFGEAEIGEDDEIKARINCSSEGNLYNILISGDEFSAIVVAGHLRIGFHFVPAGEDGQYLIKKIEYYCFIEEREARLAAYRLIDNYYTNGHNSEDIIKLECGDEGNNETFVAENQQFVIDEEERIIRDSYKTKFVGKLDNLEISPINFGVVLLGETNVEFFFMPINGTLSIHQIDNLC